MQIYWLVMTGLLLFPWFLVIAPAIALARRRLSPAPHRRNQEKQWAWLFLVLFTILILGGATVAFAVEPPLTRLERLHDGARGVTTGWTELFHVIAVETVERGPVVGLLVGSIGGSHQALSHTTRGIYDTVTFFLPVPRPQLTPSEPGRLLEVRF
jgi:putative exosortase-associated protein (TIGR04073 family)